MIHEEQSELHGKTFQLKEDAKELSGKYIIIEDWWDRVNGHGESWQNPKGDARAQYFWMREGNHGDEDDDEVLLGTIDGLEYLVHIDELII